MSDNLQRYFVYLSYNGAAYHGWQRQPNAVSVQERLEDALSLLLGRPVVVVGAGRTDTGVHAALMVAHFDAPPLDTAHLAFRLNCLLPADIAVKSVVPVKADAHARFSATSRAYHYFISLRKSAFCGDLSTRIYYRPDFFAMNRAAALLLDTRDFGSFCKAGSDNKTTICHVTEARWTQAGDDLWRFRIVADRFLRNMVRAVVGTLLEVGKGRMTLDEFQEVIRSGRRSAAGDSVPAQGLFLVDVGYPDSIFPDKAGKDPEKKSLSPEEYSTSPDKDIAIPDSPFAL